MYAIKSVEKDPLLGFRHFHLAWRSEVLVNAIYFIRLRKLVAEAQRTGSTKRFACNTIGPIDLAEITMLGAACFVLREDEIGHWLFTELVRVLAKPERVVERDAIIGGSVGAYLLRLYGLWRPSAEIDRLLANVEPEVYGPYAAIFAHWNDRSQLDEHVHRLADLHAYKSVNYTYPDEDGIYCLVGWNSEFPAELLFLNLAREQLGLSRVPCEHPMMAQNPFAKIHTEDFSSGYDEYFALTLEKLCEEGFDTDQLFWEKRFQAIGPTDPRRVTILP